MRRPRAIVRMAAACVVASALVPSPAAQSGASPAAPLTLAALEAMALERSPALQQAELAIARARGLAQQAGSLPNPTVGYTAEEVSGGPIIRRGEHGMFVEQTIPLGGKLRLRREVFTREATQAERERDRERLRVLSTLRLAFYEALAAARRVDVREQQARLAGEAASIAAQLFNTGVIDRSDVLEAEGDARRGDLALARARADSTRRWRALATAAGRPDLPAAPLAGSLDGPLPELPREETLQRLLVDSPHVLAARAAVEVAEAALARAKRATSPDLVIRGGPSYNRELLDEAPSGGRRVVGWEASLDVGITLPLFDRNTGGIAAAVADAGRARAEVMRRELEVRTRFDEVYNDYRNSLAEADTFRREILPRRQEAYELLLARYKEMGAAYPQVLRAHRALIDAGDEHLAAVERAWRGSVMLQGLLATAPE